MCKDNPRERSFLPSPDPQGHCEGRQRTEGLLAAEPGQIWRSSDGAQALGKTCSAPGIGNRPHLLPHLTLQPRPATPCSLNTRERFPRSLEGASLECSSDPPGSVDPSLGCRPLPSPYGIARKVQDCRQGSVGRS